MAVGILGVEQFIKADYQASAWSGEGGIQQARGFQFAARGTWYDPSTGAYVETFIIHYATASGADSDYLDQVQVDAKDYDSQGSFAVPDIPQSKVYVKTELDSYGNAATMISLLTGEQQALKQS